MTAKAASEHWTQRLFLLSLLAKGALGLLQLATSAALFLGLSDRLPALAQRLVRAELAEDPHDFLASRILRLAGSVPSSDLSFYTVYFAAHGALHVVVVLALLSGASWAYSGAILVLAGFVIYQILEWISVGGVMLLLLSAIDLAVIYLTAREWKQRQPR